MSSVELVLSSLVDTAALGSAVGEVAEPGDTIYLNGELGAGKTTLTKSIADALGIDSSSVTSPTFSLIHEYFGGRLPLFHLDLYRLDKPGELQNLGFDDYASSADGIIIVEWAIKALDELPDDALSISFTTDLRNQSSRNVSLSSNGPSSDALLDRIKRKIAMLILAVDTSTEYATFAVGNSSGILIASNVFEHDRHLSQTFYAGMDKALTDADTTFDQIDILAVGIGPGSFTGVRVAVTSLRTLAQVSKKILVGVGTLAVYATDALGSGHKNVIVVLPSRKNELYFQQFQDGAPLSEPSVISVANLENILEADGRFAIAGQLGTLPKGSDRYITFPQTAPPPAALILEAVKKIQAETYADPLSLVPAYAAPPAISQHKSKATPSL